MARIELENVDLTFRIFDYRGQSLRLKLLDYAVGGRFETNKAVTQVHALKNLNLFIQEGNAIGLYGHNGSGKTSFLRLLSNIYAPTRGRCFIEGKQRSLLSVSVGMEPSLSGRENLYRIGLLNGFTYDEIRGYETILSSFLNWASTLIFRHGPIPAACQCACYFLSPPAFQVISC